MMMLSRINYSDDFDEIRTEISEHFATMWEVLTKRKDEFRKQSKDVELDEYLLSLLQTFYNYIVLKEHDQNFDTMSYLTLMNDTLTQTKALSGWTDTWDILTNPEEMALFKKTDEKTDVKNKSVVK